MAYYAVERSNDTIKHFGILGMHWGIRRFQPYSQVPRKSGKSGKEIGEAKKSSKSDPAADSFERKYERIRNTAKTDEEKDILLRDLELNRDLGDSISKVRKDKYGYLHIDYKDGDEKIDFFADGKRRDVTGLVDPQKEIGVDIKETILDYKKNRDAINKAAFEAIKNEDYYKYWAPDGMSEKEFYDRLAIRSVYNSGLFGTTEVSVYEKEKYDTFDGMVLGGHSLDMEMDFNNPKTPRQVSMNGQEKKDGYFSNKKKSTSDLSEIIDFEVNPSEKKRFENINKIIVVVENKNGKKKFKKITYIKNRSHMVIIRTY